MELHLQSHHFTNRLPDWRAAALAGVAAGVVFLLLEMLMALAMSGSAWGPPRMIGAIVLGRGVLPPPATFSLGILLTALGVHLVLSIILGLIAGLIIAPFRFDSSLGTASVVGAVFGLVVYVINFYGMTQFFPWFAEARNWMSVFAHLVFGVVVADAYLKLERKEPAVAAG
jgi:hypothetical protein